MDTETPTPTRLTACKTPHLHHKLLPCSLIIRVFNSTRSPQQQQQPDYHDEASVANVRTAQLPTDFRFLAAVRQSLASARSTCATSKAAGRSTARRRTSKLTFAGTAANGRFDVRFRCAEKVSLDRTNFPDTSALTPVKNDLNVPTVIRDLRVQIT